MTNGRCLGTVSRGRCKGLGDDRWQGKSERSHQMDRCSVVWCGAVMCGRGAGIEVRSQGGQRCKPYSEWGSR